MATYIKLESLEEYCVSDDGQYIMKRYNGSEWTTKYVVPNGKKVMNFRPTRTGAQVQVLFSDGCWYEDNGHGFLHLTHEEREKDWEARKAEKEVRKEKKNTFKEGFRKAKNPYDTLLNINDSSEFEADANQIYDDYLSQQQNWMDDAYATADAMDRLIQKNARKRDIELDKLRKFEEKIIARESKEHVFLNLEKLLEWGVAESQEGYIEIAKYTGVGTKDGIEAIARAMNGYQKSVQEVSKCDKFFKFWSEIFFLISEGLLFQSHHIDFIVKLIDKELEGSNHSDLEQGDNWEDYLKMCYSKFSRPLHWGYNFEKLPYEDKIKARIDFLSFSINLDEPYVYDRDLDELLSKANDSRDFTPKTPGRIKPTKQTVNLNNIFPELKETFKSEKIEDESIKPKGIFDFSTRNRNRKVENLKEKRRELQLEIDDSKKNIRKVLISILKLIKKRLEKEKLLEETKAKHTKTDREKDRQDEKIDKINDQIGTIKDELEVSHEDVKDHMKNLLSCVSKYNKVNQELFVLTSSNRYEQEFIVQGNSINIAKSISQEETMKDLNSLYELFREYLE